MTASNLKPLLESVIAGKDLSREEAHSFLDEVMKGHVSEILLSSFLTALKIKGEKEDEITGFVEAMRNHAVAVKETFDFDFIDTCGTGGDGKGSLNVSTLSAFVLASLGLPVAKHGNRSVSSLSGSSDVLESLGYPLQMSHTDTVAYFLKHQFVFLFAPNWHPAMKYAAPVRKELGIRTFFNLIGPLSNPFRPKMQVIGVYDVGLLPLVAGVLHKLQTRKAIVCHSRDGLDEFSIFSPTDYIHLEDGKWEKALFDPKELKGLSPLRPEEVFQNTKEASQALFLDVLQGKNTSGSDMVALNAGAALFLAGKSKSISEGYTLAKSTLLEKKVLKFVRETLNLS
ncbi:anthranilate phosphoribosyltransferase [Leptospira ryugenii]|uniref:Anthranilate phosphoribosyltransferase n=1 Tax=Leptospira ryugenii TaxID=1917863 RepID=A0A2P2DY21_9LEPT|nr:anthranilate phosphoribosyltransferase [Leptospira ryugenii]GBF49522.1 anthranilate phosphoribosyltransferase [Leptospira ryugenii]